MSGLSVPQSQINNPYVTRAYLPSTRDQAPSPDSVGRGFKPSSPAPSTVASQPVEGSPPAAGFASPPHRGEIPPPIPVGTTSDSPDDLGHKTRDDHVPLTPPPPPDDTSSHKSRGSIGDNADLQSTDPSSSSKSAGPSIPSRPAETKISSDPVPQISRRGLDQIPIRTVSPAHPKKPTNRSQSAELLKFFEGPSILSRMRSALKSNDLSALYTASKQFVNHLKQQGRSPTPTKASFLHRLRPVANLSASGQDRGQGILASASSPTILQVEDIRKAVLIRDLKKIMGACQGLLATVRGSNLGPR